MPTVTPLKICHSNDDIRMGTRLSIYAGRESFRYLRKTVLAKSVDLPARCRVSSFVTIDTILKFIRHRGGNFVRLFERANCEISRTRRMYNGDESVSSRETRLSSSTWPLAGCACQTAFFHRPLPSSRGVFFLSFGVPRGDGTRNFNCKR